MIIKTRGIVLRFTKFRETSIIVKIYTEEVGLSSFIVNNVRSAKSKFKPGYFEPLSLVEITAYHQPDRDINRLNEIKSLAPLHSLRQDIHKSSIILFLAEILVKVIIERDANPELFQFIYGSLVKFDKLPENNNFHLQFLLQLAPFLGFGIESTDDFIRESAHQSFYKDEINRNHLQELILADFSSLIRIDSKSRATILNDIILYYQQHLDLPKLKSLEVLSTIFR